MTPTRMWPTWTGAAAVGLACAAAGCNPAPREPAPPVQADAGPPLQLPQDPKTTVPRPDPAQIAFDPEARTLTLYDLPDKNARWMLATPRNAKGAPVANTHQFPDDVDADAVAVFYTTGGGHASPRVTLREIVRARQIMAGPD